MVKISIVTPMYNSFDMLKKNLEVIGRQSACEIELVLVDDCSSDGSYQKALDFAKNAPYKVVALQNEKNGGPGVSRNNGIKNASGDYITFVDSDDYLSEDFSEKIVPLITQGYDCVIFDYKNVDEEGKDLSFGQSISISEIKSGNICVKDALVYTYGTTWCKIYKKSIIDKYDVKYGEFFRNEDMPFTKHALARCESVYYLNLPLYNYVQQPNSLMHNDKLLDEKNCQRAFAILSESVKDLKLDEELASIKLREVLNTTVKIRLIQGVKKREIRKYIKENYEKGCLKNKYFKGYPKYVRIMSKLIYYKQLTVMSVLFKYKKKKKA